MKMLPLMLVAGAAWWAWRRYGNELVKKTGVAPATTDDDAVLREVEARTAEIAGPGNVRVSVREGTVTLKGTVSRSERDRILRATLASPGVQSVVNQLEAEGGEIAEAQSTV